MKKDFSDIDEFNISKSFSFLLRNKQFITRFTLVFFTISLLYAFLRKPKWTGEFEIVLETNNNNSELSSLGSLPTEISQEYILPTSFGNKLKTEAKILSSRSILYPIYNFLKTQDESEVSILSNLSYRKWKDSNIRINLEKQTSVLNIQLSDYNKNLVLKALDKISNSYQIYSGMKRMRQLELTMNYLSDRINLYKKNTVESLVSAQDYAISNDLSPFDGRGENDNEILSSIDLETIRITSANKIRQINYQLSQLNRIKKYNNAIVYFIKNIEGIPDSDIAKKLISLQKDYAILSSSLQDADILLKENLKLQDIYRLLLVSEIEGYLQGKLLDAESRLKSAERPKGVLIKYNELVRETIRNQSMLADLERQKEYISLEKARKLDPWQLISMPSLLDKPKPPRKKQIVAIGSFFGFILSILVSYYKEQKHKNLFYFDEVIKELPYKVIARVDLNSLDLNDICILVEQNNTITRDYPVGLLFIGDFLALFNSQKYDTFKNQLDKEKFLLIDDLNNFTTKNIILLVSSTVNLEEINKINNIISLSNVNVEGVITFGL